MQTAQISIPVDGTQMPGYLARPDSKDPAPAVIVLQEIFGVNAEMRRITELVASVGYVGVAINFFHRTDPGLDCAYDEAGRAKGREAASKVTRATMTADLNATVDWLNAAEYVRFNRIATWGFCFGGSMAFWSATLRGISGAIAFYGGQIAKPLMSGESPLIEDVRSVKAPVLFGFGGQDPGITADDVQKIEREMRGSNKRYEIKVYPDKGHAFFRESSQALGDPDIADSWARAQAFLRARLH